MKYNSTFDCDSTLSDDSNDSDSSSVIQFIFQDYRLTETRNIVDLTCSVDALSLSDLETVDSWLIHKYNRFENSNLLSFKKRSRKSDQLIR